MRTLHGSGRSADLSVVVDELKAEDRQRDVGFREALETIMNGVNRDGQAKAILVQPDGTLRIISVTTGVLPNGVEATVALENGSELVTSPYPFFNSGSGLAKARVEDVGFEQAINNYGEISGTPTAMELSALGHQLIDWTRNAGEGRPIHADPTLLTVAGANTVHTVPALAIDRVEIELVNIGAGNEIVTVHVVGVPLISP